MSKFLKLGLGPLWGPMGRGGESRGVGDTGAAAPGSPFPRHL